MLSRGWRNWQTRYFEVVVPVRAWRFKSSPAHFSEAPKGAFFISTCGDSHHAICLTGLIDGR